MRVHPSNYRIVDLLLHHPYLIGNLAHQAELPLYEDAGSGALLDPGVYGLADEPIVSESIAAGRGFSFI